MAKPHKICAVTTTRADFGLLQSVLVELKNHPDWELQLVVGGTHLLAEFGSTIQEIEAAGFQATSQVDFLKFGDDPHGVCQALSLATEKFSEAFQSLQPDMILLLGDRYEILAAGQAALVHQIPIAHIFGGDVTEGAIDEAIRHSLTKMSHLHFVTHEEARKRVVQLGENPQNVHCVGNPGLDGLLNIEDISREELAEQIGFEFQDKNLLITYHPVTVGEADPTQSLQELLSGLSGLGENVGLLFTGSNADTFHKSFRPLIENFVQKHPHAAFVNSLGHKRYFQTLKHVDVVVGNSSSGVLEVPSFGIPTVNVGDRQKGRPQAESVLQCNAVATEVQAAIQKALSLDCSSVENLYGDGQAARRIAEILGKIEDPKRLLKKSFRDL